MAIGGSRLVGIVCYNYKCTMWLEMKMKGPLLYVSVYLVGPQHNALCRKGQIMCLILIAFQGKMHKIYHTYIHSVHSLLNFNPCTQMQVLIYCILGIFHFFEPMQSYAFAVSRKKLGGMYYQPDLNKSLIRNSPFKQLPNSLVQQWEVKIAFMIECRSNCNAPHHQDQ